MFAMLCGAWPRTTSDGVRLAEVEAAVLASDPTPAALDALVERAVGEAVTAQVDAGMDLVTDGGVRWADPLQVVLGAIGREEMGRSGPLVRAWQAAAGLTDRMVAQVVPGPWTLARRDLGESAGLEAIAARAAVLADALATGLATLGDAGCPMVQVLEPAATTIGEETVARAGFRRAHERLLRDVAGLHVMLGITGGSAAAAGADTVLGAPYASYLFDLVAGPDNWYLARAVPGDRGVVCAALRAGDGRERLDQAPELVWAAHYAASANGRGMDRVGIANATPLGALDTAEAVQALRALARAAHLATLPPAEAMREGLDPQALARGDRLQALREVVGDEPMAGD